MGKFSTKLAGLMLTAKALYEAGNYQDALTAYEQLASKPGWARLMKANLALCRLRLGLPPFKLSVIVPVFNTGKCLEQCLHSIQCQTEPSLELIVINDGSTDNSLDIIQKMMQQDKRIVLINNVKPSGNPGTPRNQGIAIARGEYLGFVDSDDWVETDYFASLLAAIEPNGSDMAFAAGYTNHLPGECKIVTYKGQQFCSADKDVQGYHPSFMIWDKVYRTGQIRSHAIKLGETKAAVDVPFIFKAYYWLKNASFASTTGYHYRRESDSSVTVNFRKNSNCDFELQAYKDVEAWCREAKVSAQYRNLVLFRKVSSYIDMLAAIEPDGLKALFDKIKPVLHAIDGNVLPNIAKKLDQAHVADKFKAITTGDAEGFRKVSEGGAPNLRSRNERKKCAIGPNEDEIYAIDDMKKGNFQDCVKKNYKLLWSGFANIATKKMAAQFISDETNIVEKNYISYALFQYFFASKQYYDALHHLTLITGEEYATSCSFLKTICFLRLNDYRSAKETLDANTFIRDSFYGLLLYQSCLEADDSLDAYHRAMQRLSLLNKALALVGLTPLSLKDEGKDLSFSNICCKNAAPYSGEMPLVSVIMPAYNAELTISYAIESVLAQTWKNLELIVVDDASSDKTVDVVSCFAQKDSRVKLIRNKTNIGCYPSRNEGLKSSSGKFITVHDSDDWSHPQKIACQAAALQMRDDLVGLYSHCVLVDDALRFIGAWLPFPMVRMNSSSFMFKKEIVSRQGYWDEVRHGGDTEYIERAKVLFGQSSVVVTKRNVPLSFIYTSNNSLTRSLGSSLVTLQHVNSSRYIYRQFYECCHEKMLYKKIKQNQPAQTKIAALLKCKNNKYDVIIVSDFAMTGGTLHCSINYIKAAINQSYSVGILHWPRHDLNIRKLNTKLIDICETSPVHIITSGDEIEAKNLIFYYPMILRERPDLLPKITAEKIFIVCSQFCKKYIGDSELLYDPLKLSDFVEKTFGRKPTWAAISGYIKKLMAQTKKYSNITDQIWYPLLEDVSSLHKACAQPPSGKRAPIIGRHGRDSVEKWPSRAETIKAAYAVDTEIKVKFMGGANVPLKILGFTPKNWEILPFDAEPLANFLSGIDFLVHFPHEQWVEAFGRVIMEAMAYGKVVILPPIFQQTFGEAAVYCAPNNVVNTAKRIWADQKLYITYAQRGLEFVQRNCSYATLPQRLAN